MKCPPKFASTPPEGLFSLFDKNPRDEGDCAAIERQELSRGNFCRSARKNGKMGQKRGCRFIFVLLSGEAETYMSPKFIPFRVGGPQKPCVAKCRRSKSPLAIDLCDLEAGVPRVKERQITHLIGAHPVLESYDVSDGFGLSLWRGNVQKHMYRCNTGKEKGRKTGKPQAP